VGEGLANRALEIKLDDLMTLRITSCLAGNADPHIALIAEYLARCLGQPVDFDMAQPWPARELGLDTGQVQAGWLCGWPYIRKVDAAERPPLEVLAAPVMKAARYQGRPIYFSDVVVRAGSSFNSFADLRGATFAYNEPGSQSGFNIVRHHLASLGETWSYFGRVVQSGSHAASLQMIRAGQADAAAIDSTMLDTELENDPALAAETRIVDQLGPAPMPPWVARTDLPAELRQALRAALLGMHTDPAGQAVLERARYARFAPASDSDYDLIRDMVRIAGHLEAPG
jgi:phosphonate transport system substrate-binding protein